MKRSRRSGRLGILAALVLAGPGAGGAAAQPQVPSAVYQDPPGDPAHPASGRGVTFISHGAQINAQLYRPAGAGAHPTAILLHGLPGNEQNLDLARVMQRAGWTVLSFHYRGSWGSGGGFTLAGGCEDLAALLAKLDAPEAAAAWGVDRAHVVVIGHSYGGYVAACGAAAHPELLGAGLIAPWDISYDARAWSKLSPAERRRAATATFDDVDGRLAGTDAFGLLEEAMAGSAAFDLARFAPALAHHPLLVITATRDDADDEAIGLLAALKARPSAKLTTAVLETDHGFNDRRIALQVALLHWLAALPGAPPPP